MPLAVEQAAPKEDDTKDQEQAALRSLSSKVDLNALELLAENHKGCALAEKLQPLNSLEQMAALREIAKINEGKRALDSSLPAVGIHYYGSRGGLFLDPSIGADLTNSWHTWDSIASVSVKPMGSSTLTCFDWDNGGSNIHRWEKKF